jgi:hypothetical protein
MAGLNEIPSDHMQAHMIEFPSMKISDTDIPPITEKEPIPVSQLDYIRDQALDFLHGALNIVDSGKHSLGKDVKECLRIEILKVERRVLGLRAYVIHKVAEMKIRQTLIDHRLEQVMINSIKVRNEAIYKMCTHLKECVESVNYLLKIREKTLLSTIGNLLIHICTSSLLISDLVLRITRSSTGKNLPLDFCLSRSYSEFLPTSET